MFYIGEVPSYYCKTNDWKLFVERLNIYFDINDLTKENDHEKRAILLTTVCPEIYANIRNLCAPKLPENVSFTKLMDLLNGQYEDNGLTFEQRNQFYKAKQMATNETILEWYQRIQNLSKGCKFGDEYSDVMLDKFVSGLKKSYISEKIHMLPIDMKLYSIIELAVKFEIKKK